MLNKDNFKQEVEDNAGLILVDFFAPWCGPCQIMSPVIDEMIKEYNGQDVKVAKLNIDENQEIASKYGVMSIPTFLVFKAGKAVDKKLGYCDKEELVQMINRNK